MCSADQFPKGRKRLAWEPSGPDSAGWQTTRLRGGVYEYKKYKTCEEQNNERQVEQFKDPKSFRESMVEHAAFLGRLLIDYASGDYERRLAGEAHLWLDAESQRRLAEIQSQLVAALETARVCGPRAKPNLRLVIEHRAEVEP